jgi:hypothetical protein
MTEQDKILSGMVCPYCGADSEYVDSSVIYGKSYGMIYLCRPCDAYVGTHKSEPTKAKGRLANRELRWEKIRAHAHFDFIWQNKHMTRSEAYVWLSKALGIDPELCHIGMFDISECEKVIELSKLKLESCLQLS